LHTCFYKLSSINYEVSTTVVNQKQSSSSMLAQEVDNKVNVGQAHANTSEAANDLDAAKVAAMKAAELGTQYFYIYVIDI